MFMRDGKAMAAPMATYRSGIVTEISVFVADFHLQSFCLFVF